MGQWREVSNKYLYQMLKKTYWKLLFDSDLRYLMYGNVNASLLWMTHTQESSRERILALQLGLFTG